MMDCAPDGPAISAIMHVNMTKRSKIAGNRNLVLYMRKYYLLTDGYGRENTHKRVARMSFRVLITTTSFLDTRGGHLELLERSNLDIVTARGPLDSEELMSVAQQLGPFDGALIGEDEFNNAVFEALSPRLRIISRYGAGVEKIDLESAQRHNVVVTNTPGATHEAVAELAFGLLLALVRNIPEENSIVHQGLWRRFTGRELSGKTIGIFGLGGVGQEMSKRSLAFGMRVLVHNTSWSNFHQSFLDNLNSVFSAGIFKNNPPHMQRLEKVEDVLRSADIITLHMNLNKSTEFFLNRRSLGQCRRGVWVINVSRGRLVDQEAMAQALRNGQVGGFAADVLDPHPVTPDNPLLGLPNVILTPHIGARTVESVERQGTAAVNNMLAVLRGDPTGNIVVKS